MNKQELDNKNKLIQPNWTNSLYLCLEYIDIDHSKENKVTVSQKEISDHRFENNDIAACLIFLWKNSKASYWKHINETFNKKNVGLIWDSKMEHCHILCNNVIADNIFKTILQFTFENTLLDEKDKERVFCIIDAQINKFKKYSFVKKHIENLDIKSKYITKQLLKSWIGKECKYNVS